MKREEKNPIVRERAQGTRKKLSFALSVFSCGEFSLKTGGIDRQRGEGGNHERDEKHEKGREKIQLSAKERRERERNDLLRSLAVNFLLRTGGIDRRGRRGEGTTKETKNTKREEKIRQKNIGTKK